MSQKFRRSRRWKLFFRAVLLSLCEHQGKYTEFRRSVVQNLKTNYDSIIATVNVDVSSTGACKCADEFKKNGSRVGEDSLLATTDFLQSDAHVFVWTVNESPQIYQPVSEPAYSGAPVVLALYEPGHYCSVISEPCNVFKCIREAHGLRNSLVMFSSRSIIKKWHNIL